jgi:mannan endo-1,4-beta-mannosidase
MAPGRDARAGGRTVSANTERTGLHRQRPQRPRTPRRRRWLRRAVAIGATAAAAAVLVFAVPRIADPGPRAPASQSGRFALPTARDSYIGLYSDGVPKSYAGVTAFSAATGVQPNLVSYYSGWWEPFQAGFATSVARNGAVPLIQVDPTGISIGAIASGRYDAYLSTFAEAVRAYHRPVVMGFGHEMNGYWYSWSYQHTSPAVFVAAWRHIVNLFRAEDARNVTWMWTINVIHQPPRVQPPRPWWPGEAYVTWVGIDGYYDNPSSTFASLFGPTIAAVRALTPTDPILVSETAVAPAAGQPAKIADLFAGIRLYGLLGFVWFDSVHVADWRLSGRAAIAAFRRGAEAYHRPAP